MLAQIDVQRIQEGPTEAQKEERNHKNHSGKEGLASYCTRLLRATWVKGVGGRRELREIPSLLDAGVKLRNTVDLADTRLVPNTLTALASCHDMSIVALAWPTICPSGS